MLMFAYHLKKPAAIRYPKGSVPSDPQAWETPMEYGKSRIAQQGTKTAILAVGACFQEARKAAKQMEEKGCRPTLVDVRFVAPIDEEMLRQVLEEHELVITIEDHVYTGGYGMRAAAMAQKINAACQIECISLPDRFLAQDSRSHILEEYGVSAEGILQVWQKKKD